MTTPLLIEETNLSIAWTKVLKNIIEQSGKEISPLLLSLTEFNDFPETQKILDLSLKSNGMATVKTVSETIFPDSLYRYCGKDRFKLYKEYSNNLHRIKKIDKSNRNGTYFERLIAFDGVNAPINQLEIIISSLESVKIKRRSKLQASIFNPVTDHTNLPFQGFPCLQHVTFYKSEDNGLIMNGFYAIQYVYRRAYGNWLGLINLGKFIANELGIEFERLNCYVGVEVLDHLTKNQAQKLLDSIK
jgi:thymidylate synthase